MPDERPGRPREQCPPVDGTARQSHSPFVGLAVCREEVSVLGSLFLFYEKKGFSWDPWTPLL